MLLMHISQVREKLSNAFNEIEKGNYTKESIEIITAYTAAVTLYPNGQ